MTPVLDGKRRWAVLVAASAGAYREAAQSPLGTPFPGLETSRAGEGRGSALAGTPASAGAGELDALNAAFGEYLAVTNSSAEQPDAGAIGSRALNHGLLEV